ncbi:helix-turn-helix transcriptional regulator [Clostridium sporogenes]|uniref:helix-turn-helix transcriptional regulator n=1 Tax=Clostridium sporogenes TaxID=1509 RepID=UPI002238AA6F|nr:helix-turn-helix transcriptional regulator [Clostridium sporogenes]MCW6111625.1 helix-turn-helix transcriptional regulator [Clostridium sporogenes]
MGIKIKVRRTEKMMKQKELAKEVGISIQYLNALENGRANNPSIPVMKKISEILEIPVQELFFNE